MSIDLNWSTLTSGPDGEALEASIRDFIHTKFQSVPLPRFIKSVTVHDFSFGSVPPELELKDITDPLPDFYEHSDSEDSDEDVEDGDKAGRANGSGIPNGEDEDLMPEGIKRAAERRRERAAAAAAAAAATATATASGGSTTGQHHHHHNRQPHHHHPEHIHLPNRGAGRVGPPQLPDLGQHFPAAPPPQHSPMFFGAGALTPGIPGGTTNMHYFHSQFASGTQTPLLAAAAASAAATGGKGGGYGFGTGEVHHSVSSPDLWAQGVGRGNGVRGGNGGGEWLPGRGHARQASSGSVLSVGDELVPGAGRVLREKHSVSTLAPTSAGTSRPPTRENDEEDGEGEREQTPGLGRDEGKDGEDGKPRMREPRVDDVQAVFRIRYAGDVKLLLTADILLDYPMPSFVGIPVRLSITGLTFDGVGVLAKIRKRAHFCFLSPEDAVAAVGGEENKEEVEGEQRHGAGNGLGKSTKMGGLLQEIRVESEIGQREGGKQSLKNVGKVERFVLEQVRRIFEEEFVYPSFWTFLV